MKLTDKINVFNQDCMDVMGGYEDKYFDLAIVDPPYGLQATGNLSRMNGAGKLKDRALNMHSCEFDKILPDKSYFKELFRVSTNQIIWGGNYFDLPPTRGIICWDKEQPWPNFSQWEMAWTSFDKPAKLFRFNNKGFRGEGKAIHPTQKPIALYSWILENYATENMRIIDTHLGSGSSAIAAHRYGITEFIGTELDKNYFDSFVNRFNTESSQGNLFHTDKSISENNMELFA